MFKASIALVLVAFTALAYGWIAGNDAVLYGSIGASALAGLALLASTRSGSDSAHQPLVHREEPEVATVAPRERDRTERRRGRKRADGPDSRELTRQLDLPEESQEFFDEDEAALRPRERRRPARAEPVPAASGEFEDYPYEEDSGYRDDYYAADETQAFEEYPQAPESGPRPGAADFRSRLAAVLGTSDDAAPQASPAPRSSEPPEEPDEPAPAPVRGRRTPRSPVQPVEEEEEFSAPRTRRAAEPDSAEAPPPAPRRGRKRAEPVLSPDGEADQETGSGREAAPLVRPVGGVRVTQPGGGFARPDAPEGITAYRPRRPGVPTSAPSEESAAPAAKPRRRRSEEEAPAPVRRRVSPAEKTAARKRSGAGSAVTRVTRDSEPTTTPQRRGRPPKSKS